MAVAKIPPETRRYTSILVPLTAGGKHDWFYQIEFNGVPVDKLIEGPLELTCMVLWSEEHGAIFYGEGPEKFDRILYREKGGVVTIPWVIIGGVLYVGFLREFRSNAHGTFLFALGGMVTVQKTCCAAMQDKAMEKANIDVSHAVELGGCRGMFNRLMHDGDPLDNKDGLEKFYGLRVDPMDLEYSEEKEGYLLASGRSVSKKKADLIFRPWFRVALESPDLIGLSALMRLIAFLEREGVIEVKEK